MALGQEGADVERAPAVFADLHGLPLVDFRGDPYVTCLDLGRAGAVYTEGYEREVRAADGRSAASSTPCAAIDRRVRLAT